VVAIISVLAAIATPNFLEAQTRAKLARVKSDQRTIATALDTYVIDHNVYPPSESMYVPLPSRRFDPLTTPISYLTSVPRDPFKRKPGNSYEDSIRAHDPKEPLDIYLYDLAAVQTGGGGGNGAGRNISYSLTRGGPDGHIHCP